eukprot:m.58951 g.58951  ORF g.58951 m.58951 type:complete len:520 (+) comp17275_c0_seq1:52-1611(+)
MRASPSFLGPSLSICNALVLLTCTCGTLGTALLPAWTSTHASLCDSTFNSAKTVFGTNFAQCYALCAKTANCSQFAVTNANWHQQSKNPACNLAPPCAEQCTTSPGYCKNWNTYTCASGAAATCSSPLPPTPGPGPGPGPPPPPPPPPAPITFKLSATLHDSMVLQRAPAAAVVWGFAPRGTTVTTTFGGETIISTANSTTVGAPHCCVWRAKLPPTAANSTPQTISFAASTGERATLQDVLFGDVYICGGQSNMAFSVGGNENAAAYRKEADKYPSIRLFTVGQGTKSHVPRSDLATIEQNWEAASSTTVSDGSRFNYFSAVCWFFGKNVHDGLGGTVPIGLVSNNWPGTKVEQWTPPETTAQCGHAATGELYNAMIVPYTVGPMAVSGFAWCKFAAGCHQPKLDVGSSRPHPCRAVFAGGGGASPRASCPRIMVPARTALGREPSHPLAPVPHLTSPCAPGSPPWRRRTCVHPPLDSLTKFPSRATAAAVQTRASLTSAARRTCPTRTSITRAPRRR